MVARRYPAGTIFEFDDGREYTPDSILFLQAMTEVVKHRTAR